ncbi:MAG: hypothetical protein RI922_195 [Bacteroidota bacterium]|jgi:hypothetical protein
MKEQNELEHLFSSTFDGFEVTPPSHIKSAIDESLFSGKAPVHKKRGFIWLFPLIGFFFIVSFITLSFNTRNHSTKISNSSSTQLANQTTYASAKDSKTVNNTENQTIITENQHADSNGNQSKLANEQHQFFGVNNTQKNKVEGKLNDVKNNVKTSELFKKGGFKNEINQPTKKSKNQKTKEKAQKASERSNVIDDFSKDKLNDNFALAVNSTEDSETEAKSTNISKNEEKAKEGQNEKHEDATSINEKQKESVASVDTSKSSIQETQIAPLFNPSKWSIGLYTGTFLGVNSLSSNSNNYYEINSPAGFNSSFEVNYGLNSKWSITAGLGYSTFNESVSAVIYDTTFIPNGTTVEYIYLNPALQDSIIDSIVTVNYITEIAASNAAQKINYSVFSLPIYGSFSLFKKGNWSSSLMAGIRLNFNKATVTNLYEGIPGALISTPEIKQFGLSAALRPEITYAFGKFGLGVYLNTSFDLIPITRWSDIDKKRFDLGGGVVLKYRF